MNINAKPFVKWAGGKTQLINSIKTALPDNFSELSNVTYVEPFVGGGAVLFWILQNYPNISKAIINDINPDLICAYKTIKLSPGELINKLKIIENEYTKLSEVQRKDYFLNSRKAFNLKSLQPVENTAMFIFLNRTCFNGLYRVNSKGHFNVPFGRYPNPKICDEQTIWADSELLQKVEIVTGDFENTLSDESSYSFFYLDPPYKPLNLTSSFNSYTKELFNDEEQVRLSKFCSKINSLGHMFILSNSDVKSTNPTNDFFDVLYGEFSINRVFASRMINSNASQRGKLTELLITNINNMDYVKAI